MKDKITFMTEMEEIKNTFFNACDKLFDEAKKEQETEGKRVLKRGQDFYTYSNSCGLTGEHYTNALCDKLVIINKQAFFTEEEATLYAEVHEELLLACCGEILPNNIVHSLACSYDTTSIINIGQQSGIIYAETYQTNDKEKLEEAIKEIGQEKLKAFFNLKPILPSEVEGWEW